MTERKPPPDRTPTHVHDRGAKTTRCGISMKSKDRLPYVGAEFVAMHVKGRGMVVCPRCAEVASG
jgi:hypothetical protein